jgi:hypothetical protein
MIALHTFILLILVHTSVHAKDKESSQSSSTNQNQNHHPQPKQQEDKFNPLGPLVKCSFLPMEFIECEFPTDHKGNRTAKDELGGIGCVKFGGVYYEEVEKTKVQCIALPEIECFGPRSFWREGFPCIKYTGDLTVH